MLAWRVGSIVTDFSARSFGVNFSARASFRLEMRMKTNFRLSVECLRAGLTSENARLGGSAILGGNRQGLLQEMLLEFDDYSNARTHQPIDSPSMYKLSDCCAWAGACSLQF